MVPEGGCTGTAAPQRPDRFPDAGATSGPRVGAQPCPFCSSCGTGSSPAGSRGPTYLGHQGVTGRRQAKPDGNSTDIDKLEPHTGENTGFQETEGDPAPGGLPGSGRPLLAGPVRGVCSGEAGGPAVPSGCVFSQKPREEGPGYTHGHREGHCRQLHRAQVSAEHRAHDVDHEVQHLEEELKAGAGVKGPAHSPAPGKRLSRP